MRFGSELAIWSVAWVLCTRIWARVSADSSTAMSASRITDSDAMTFSSVIPWLLMFGSIVFLWKLPSRPRYDETWSIASAVIFCAVRKFSVERSFSLPERSVMSRPTIALPSCVVLTELKPAWIWPFGVTSGPSWNSVPPPVTVKEADDSVWANDDVR